MLKAFHKVIDLQQMNVIIYLHDLFLYVYINIPFKINNNMNYHFIFILTIIVHTCMYMYTSKPIWYAKSFTFYTCTVGSQLSGRFQSLS